MDNRWTYYNPNPKHNRVGDCTVRALSKALDQDWDTTYAGLSAMGYMLSDMPSANRVWGRYLRKHGFFQNIIDDNGDDFYTVTDFCKDHPYGTYVLAILDPGHVVCVVDGMYYDSWDSGNEVPQYYWARMDEDEI